MQFVTPESLEEFERESIIWLPYAGLSWQFLRRRFLLLFLLLLLLLLLPLFIVVIITVLLAGVIFIIAAVSSIIVIDPATTPLSFSNQLPGLAAKVRQPLKRIGMIQP